MNSEVDLLSEIEAAVKREWEAEKLPLPLSALGSRLSDTARLMVRAQNISLRKFISDHLGDRIRLVSMRREGGGAVPSIESSDLSDSELEKNTRNVLGKLMHRGFFQRYGTPSEQRFLKGKGDSY